MSKLSDNQDAIARKNYSVIVQRLASVGNAAVSHALGCDESTISRMKPEKFQQLAEILAVLDLRIVSKDMQCFSKEDVGFFMYGARKYMESISSPDDLKNKEDH